MTPLDQTLEYAARALRVFPCRQDKIPLIRDWPNRATIDPITIRDWWTRWPWALIGMACGKASGRNVLDIDVKDPRAYGFDSLDELGHAILPAVPMMHTRSGGLHLHFNADVLIRNTVGKQGRGIGPGLDWRGDGGCVILPSEGSGYNWDPHYGIDTPLAPVPAELLPKEPEQRPAAKPVETSAGLSRYADGAIQSATNRIRNAPAGAQESTLNSECFAIGTLVGAGAMPESYALDMLLWAARGILDYDPRRPWRTADLERKIHNAFSRGLSKPRRAQHG